MTWLAGIVIAAFGLAFIAFTIIAFARPRVAERILMSFASSARSHYIEMAFRLLLGTSLLVRAPASGFHRFFLFLGWAIVISSTALLLMPWQWHDHFGAKVRPILLRFARVYAVGAFGLGCLLLYGVFSAASGRGP